MAFKVYEYIQEFGCHFYKGDKLNRIVFASMERESLFQRGLLLTVLHSERPELCRVFAVLSARKRALVIFNKTISLSEVTEIMPC